MVNGIKCTDMCSLKTCDNRPPEGVADDEEDEIDIDENEDDVLFSKNVCDGGQKLQGEGHFCLKLLLKCSPFIKDNLLKTSVPFCYIPIKLNR